MKDVHQCAFRWNALQLQRGIDGRPDVRLGLRLIADLPRDEGEQLVKRQHEPYATVDELANRAGLLKRAIDALAEAGALDSIAGHRHGARWSAAGVQHLSNVLRETTVADLHVAVPAPTDAQTVVADYQGLGLTLGRHPLSFLRANLPRSDFALRRPWQSCVMAAAYAWPAS